VRVVLDTNVAVSAILFEHGRLTWIREAWTLGRIRPLVDRPCLDELLRVLTCPKFRLDEAEIRSLLGSYLPHVETVEVSGPVRGLPRCKDPEDREFLELAARGGAEVLVTGDAALLDLAGRTPFIIVRPAGFRYRLSEV
jgi:putative PIN family toxin of toxin-antitoxin system